MKLSAQKFIKWTRRNLVRTDGDVILLLMEHPEGLTTEELMDTLDLRRRAVGNVLLRLKRKGLITDSRRYSGRKNLKLRNSKIKVYRLAVSLEFLK